MKLDPTIVVALIAALSSSIPALLAYISSRRNAVKLHETKELVKDIGVKVDGRLSQLLESQSKLGAAKEEAAGAKGQIKGAMEEQLRNKP